MLFVTKKQLREQLEKAEIRASIHFNKRVKAENGINEIDQIIKRADAKKENYFITLGKIREVIATQKQ